MAEVTMRALGETQQTPLEVVDRNDDHITIAVPGFGHCIVGRVKSDELIARLGEGTFLAAIAQPDAMGQPKLHKRDPIVTDEGIEVEILPNVSNEQRLRVCIPFELLPGGA